MQYTTNYNLKKPEGTDVVNIDDLNANADIIDTELAKRMINSGGVPSIQAGLDAEKPTAGATGQIYIATDTQVIYRDTGTVWVKVGAVKWGDIDNKPDLALSSDLATHSADVLHVPYAVATGSANAYTVTISGITSYKEGLAIAVKINTDNTGASTINVNGLGAKSIKKPNGNDVVAGNLKANSIYTLRYNGTNFILQGSDSAGNATAADVLAGKTFSNDSNTNITGTMVNNGAVIITPSTANQAIPAGYHNGSGYVKGDANLVAANIVAGKSIFGVNGPAAQSYSGSFYMSTTSPVAVTIGFKPNYIVFAAVFSGIAKMDFYNSINPSKNIANIGTDTLDLSTITLTSSGFIVGPATYTSSVYFIAFT
ncbi:MAG TPA: hypothetical protein GXX41_13020 [Thermoanaerobacterium sp.]|nr:hypothetical protein [Thermoanaerobacterium sp.]